MIASRKMEKAFDKSIKEIEHVLDGGQATDVTRMAVSTMGIYSRLKATEIHEAVLKCQLIKHLGGDKKILKEELKALRA